MHQTRAMSLLCLVMTAGLAVASEASYYEHADPSKEVEGLAKPEASKVFAGYERANTTNILVRLSVSAPGALPDPREEGGLTLCEALSTDALEATRIQAILVVRNGFLGEFSDLEMQALMAVADRMATWRQDVAGTAALGSITDQLAGFLSAPEVDSMRALEQRRDLARAVHAALQRPGIFEDSPLAKRFHARVMQMSGAQAPATAAPAAATQPNF